MDRQHVANAPHLDAIMCPQTRDFGTYLMWQQGIGSCWLGWANVTP